jgi:isopenicillin N synthase-like dioxygenase
MAAEPAIPTIDMAPLRIGSEAEKREVAHRIDAACRNTGFFLVTGHGVSADLITKARQRAIDFFALPLDDKMKVRRPASKISRGYNWVGDRSIAYRFSASTRGATLP